MSSSRKIRRALASKALGSLDLSSIATMSSKLDQLSSDASKLDEFGKKFEGTGDILLLLSQLQKEVGVMIASNSALQSRVQELESNFDALRKTLDIL
jgi:outer membrane murein-binding lipoprotein Lpp